jgi:hypothetical protein
MNELTSNNQTRLEIIQMVRHFRGARSTSDDEVKKEKFLGEKLIHICRSIPEYLQVCEEGKSNTFIVETLFYCIIEIDASRLV